MLTEYIQALLLIFAAEMGDKTQILAMMFATKYKTGKVLIGIFIGSFLNHGIAVAFGTFLGNMIPVYILQMIAGLAFIGFAMWTLMAGEEDDEDGAVKKSRSAIVVVAMAFFIGELGDKTQLTAITLSLDAAYPWLILLGTVSGMVVTSSLGIFVGSKVGDKLPEALIKVVSGGIFLIFGVQKLISATPAALVTIYSVTAFVLVVTIGVVLLLRTTWIAHKEGRLTPYSKAARSLYDYAQRLQISADDICRGVKHCGTCQGERCAVGFIRHLAKEIQANNYDHDHIKTMTSIRYYKDKFDLDKLNQVQRMNQAFLDRQAPTAEGYKEVELMQKVVGHMIAMAQSPEGDEDHV